MRPDVIAGGFSIDRPGPRISTISGVRVSGAPALRRPDSKNSLGEADFLREASELRSRERSTGAR